MGSPAIAVVGAGGFVGRRLLRELQTAGLPATAVVRGSPELTIDGTFHSPMQLADLHAAGRYDIVINLAYPAGGSPSSYPELNREIFRTVERLLRDGGRLIHVSTVAVFGLAGDWPTQLGPVERRRDEVYVEAKIEAEKHFESLPRRGYTLEVVRLGNVWGPASGAWTVGLVQRLLTGRPVGVQGIKGFSNATDVSNAASYLAHLIRTDRQPGAFYHHLAEFSAVPWTRWIAGLARELDVEPVRADPDVIRMPSSIGEEIAQALAPVTPRNLYRTIAGQRRSGSWARSALRMLPKSTFHALRGPTLALAEAAPLDRSEQTFLAIMSARQEFKSHVLPDWKPPVAEAESLERVLDWLRTG